MAIALLLRLLIRLAPSLLRTVRTAPEVGAPGYFALGKALLDRLHDPEELDADLKAELEREFGYAAEVTTYAAPFELRKVHFIWSVKDQVIASDDARVCTFHLLKVTGGVPSDTWVAGDFTALDAAFTTWWAALNVRYTPDLTWDRLKVYRAGPDISPPQPPVYDADKNVAGSASAGNMMPPQVAMTVTEIAGVKRYWGRFYLPAGKEGSWANQYGRIATTNAALIADSTDTLYTTLATAGLVPVVYRAALPERETKSGSTLPARAASAWTVEKIQVDDIFDVVRRRRFKYPALRTQRDIWVSRASSSPSNYISWADWAWTMQARNLLTLSEVNERLMLEYQLQGIYGIRGTL